MITSRSDGKSENGHVHNVENFVLCSCAHHACRPLLQGGVQEEELCEVALCSECENLCVSELWRLCSRTWQCCCVPRIVTEEAMTE